MEAGRRAGGEGQGIGAEPSPPYFLASCIGLNIVHFEDSRSFRLQGRGAHSMVTQVIGNTPCRFHANTLRAR